MKLLLNQLQPQQGEVKIGTKLQVAYFDQLRDQLDPEQTVADSVAEGREFIEIKGQRKHVMGYLADFLFPPARARSPVKSLSGGERNRLLLARLFTNPANLLVMDEPTNDLDVETLRALEDALEDFAGCAVIISHDRFFLDRLCTHMLAFEGDSHVEWFEGNFEDYEQDKIRRLGPESVKPKRVKYKKFTR